MKKLKLLLFLLIPFGIKAQGHSRSFPRFSESEWIVRVQGDTTCKHDFDIQVIDSTRSYTSDGRIITVNNNRRCKKCSYYSTNYSRIDIITYEELNSELLKTLIDEIKALRKQIDSLIQNK